MQEGKEERSTALGLVLLSKMPLWHWILREPNKSQPSQAKADPDSSKIHFEISLDAAQNLTFHAGWLPALFQRCLRDVPSSSRIAEVAFALCFGGALA